MRRGTAKIYAVAMAAVLGFSVISFGISASADTPKVLTDETQDDSAEIIGAVSDGIDEQSDDAVTAEDTESGTVSDETVSGSSDELSDDTAAEDTESGTAADETVSDSDDALTDDAEAGESEQSDEYAAGESEDTEPVGNQEEDYSISLLSAGDTYASGSLSSKITYEIIDNGDGTYKAVISGTGAMPDYSSYSVFASTYASTLTSVEIGEGITSIGAYTFYGCTALTSFTLADSVTTIGKYAFRGCPLTSVELGENVTTIDYAFYGCSSLKSVKLTNVSSLSHAFYNCTSLTSVDLGNAATVSDYAFYGCSSLQSVDLSNVTNVQKYGFDLCTGLTTVENSSGLTTVGNGAFKGCSSLTAIDLSGVTTIETDTFNGCSALTDVDISSATSVGIQAFESCTALTSIDLSSVTEIGMSAFSGCFSLVSVKNTDNLTSVGASAFQSCYDLEEIDLSNVTSIGNSAFYYCSALEEADLSSIESIGSKAFYNCYGLATIILGENLETIGDSAFAYLDAHQSVDKGEVVDEKTVMFIFLGDPESIGKISFGSKWLDGSDTDYVTFRFNHIYTDKESDLETILEENAGITSPVIEFTAHSLTLIQEGKAATCVDTGVQGCWYCADCSKYFSDAAATTEISYDDISTPLPIDPNNHAALTHHEGKDATCVEDGEAEYWYCSACGKYFSDAACTQEITSKDDLPIPAVKHVNAYKVEASAATCTEIGFSQECWYCPDCGKCFSDEDCTTETEDAVIPATGHDLTSYAKVAATCEEDGNIAYWYCSNCEKYFSDAKCTKEISKEDTVISATHHAKAYKVEAREATCVEVGYSTDFWYCPDCGKYFKDASCEETINIEDITIPESGHDMTQVEAMEMRLSEGTTIYHCKACGKYYINKSEDNELSREIVFGELSEGVYYAVVESEEGVFDTAYVFAESGEGVIPDYDINRRNDITASPFGDYYDSLTTVVIEDGITNVGAYTFYRCKALESVTLADSVTSIGDSAFLGCSSLVTINLGKVKTFDDNAFTGCSSLSGIDLSSAVTIGQAAFSGCSSLTSIEDISSVTTIGADAFRGCTTLTGVDLSNVTTIGAGAFQDCEALTEVDLSSVTSLGATAFQQCYGIESVTLGDGITAIGDYTFYGCTSLTTIYLNKVETIGEYAFSRCSNLSRIVIGDSLKSVGYRAFARDNSTDDHYFSLYFLSDNISDIDFYVSGDNSSFDIFYDHVTVYYFCTYKSAYTEEAVDNALSGQVNEIVDIKPMHLDPDTYTPLYSYTAPVEPWCLTEGMLGYWYCTGCDTYFLDADLTETTEYEDLSVPALGHDWGGSRMIPTPGSMRRSMMYVDDAV
ncbi:MAG: leucine-rich repeat protein [Clostridiales bacterium]|nr:leucine-rich repeat protein [Clostridiales bacterium]